MDLKQLDTFVRVAELGSFTRAAAVLHIAQPALSRQVRALEVELRQPLLERNGRGVTLTPAGALLLAHARGILQQVQRARQDLEDQRGAAAGVLCVGLPPSLSRLLTAPLVDAFQARFPRARLSVVEGLSTTLLEWLAQGRVDIAAVYNALPSAAVELQPVLQERLHLVSARPARARAGRARSQADGAAIALQQLAEHDLVIPGRPNAIRMRLEAALAEAGLRPRVALEVDSITALLDLVQRHALHAVLGAAAVQGDSREALFVARPVLLPGGAPLVVPLYMATSAQRPRGPLLQQAGVVLVQLLQAALGRG